LSLDGVPLDWYDSNAGNYNTVFGYDTYIDAFTNAIWRLTNKPIDGWQTGNNNEGL
jgi:hypothetical protein